MSKYKPILIVEDELLLATALELKLGHEGYIVEHAANGKLALDLIEKGKYSLIFLDLVMPEMDGFQVLEKLKSKGVKTPIIVQSNLSQPEDIEKAKALGATDFFVKSNTSLSEIVDKVKSFLKG